MEGGSRRVSVVAHGVDAAKCLRLRFPQAREPVLEAAQTSERRWVAHDNIEEAAPCRGAMMVAVVICLMSVLMSVASTFARSVDRDDGGVEGRTIENENKSSAGLSPSQ